MRRVVPLYSTTVLWSDIVADVRQVHGHHRRCPVRVEPSWFFKLQFAADGHRERFKNLRRLKWGRRGRKENETASLRSERGRRQDALPIASCAQRDQPLPIVLRPGPRPVNADLANFESAHHAGTAWLTLGITIVFYRDETTGAVEFYSTRNSRFRSPLFYFCLHLSYNHTSPQPPRTMNFIAGNGRVKHLQRRAIHRDSYTATTPLHNFQSDHD
ncbi:hypothetical protein B0H19DRAFT_703970 [Mycena capillaripes]|nr:hypothetical protein B0H19DRAFT_703970 [Mycena capillaripes]